MERRMGKEHAECAENKLAFDAASGLLAQTEGAEGKIAERLKS